MITSLQLIHQPIDEAALVIANPAPANMGAVVRFSGVVREMEGSEKIAALQYEAFEPMARRQFELLFARAAAQWPLHSIHLVHRLGRVPAGQISLWLQIIAPHRQEALAACAFLIDTMKRDVPIWKRPLLE